MTEVLREEIDSPAAWVNEGKDYFLFRLSPKRVDAIEKAVADTRHIPTQEIRRADFGGSEIAELAAEIYDDLRNKRGALVVSQLPQSRFSPDDYERAYWGLGMHLGKPVIQNYLGDLLTRVEKEENDGKPRDTRTKGRGYRNADEAGYHTDTNEVVGLMCVERAETGGQSVISSALSIHNDFLHHHPELLDALYEGYYQAIGQDEVMTQEKSPVFGYVDGHLSVYCQFRAMKLAAQNRGEELSPELLAAVDYFYERAKANEAEFLLEPGEMLLWNNRTQLHGRRSFENSPERKRLLLRLWLEPDNPIRIPDNFAEFTKQKIRHADYERLVLNAGRI